MKEEEFKNLDTGDIIRGVGQWMGYVVQANYGESGVILTRTMLASHAREWDLIAKAHYTDPEESQ